jgi:hypothetical protein
MPDVVNLAKAELQHLDVNFKELIKKETVQFNPESLKVSFANQLVQPPGSGDQRGNAARQFVGSATTKLALTLWFDVGSPQTGNERVDDVRKLTERIAYFIKPQAVRGKKERLPPAVRFLWGTFQFDGVMDSLEETIEYFSSDGKPLRASLALSISQQDFQFGFGDARKGGPQTGAPAAAPATPGTTPLALAPAGSSVQGIADAAGKGADWQSIAAANGIENPRALAAGAILDLDLRAPTIGAGLGPAAGLAVAPPSLSLSAGAGIGVGGGAALGTGGGFGASASIGIGG